MGLTLSALIAAAWTGPTGSPPSENVAAPINVGATGQIKQGPLGVTGYLNFGSTLGDSGYGIWDDAGTLEFKNEGGSWASLQSIIYSLVGDSTSPWQTSGTSIYYRAGNVGIGLSNPGYPLQVEGNAYVSGNIYSGARGMWMSEAARNDGGQFWIGGGYYSSIWCGWSQFTSEECPSGSVMVGYIGSACANDPGQGVYAPQALCQWIN